MDVKGYNMDAKGYAVAVKGYRVDAKGYREDVKVSRFDAVLQSVRGTHLDEPVEEREAEEQLLPLLWAFAIVKEGGVAHRVVQVRLHDVRA
eukprot:9474763-Pyramimonas_sp.AAC.1